MFNEQEKQYLWHGLIMGPLLMYVGFYGDKVSNTFFGVLLGLGILTFLYNSLRLVTSVAPPEAFGQADEKKNKS